MHFQTSPHAHPARSPRRRPTPGGLPPHLQVSLRCCKRSGWHIWPPPAYTQLPLPHPNSQVSLKCGKKERLAHVDEPSRCEYSAELETPAACTAEAAAALAAELRARQQFLGGEAEVEDTAAAAAAGGAARDEL